MSHYSKPATAAALVEAGTLGTGRYLCLHVLNTYAPFTIQYNTIQYKICKAPCCVASEALANRTVKKHRRRRTTVL